MNQHTKALAMHHAAVLGNMVVVGVLIEIGCNTKAVDWYGMGAVQINMLFG